MKIDRETLEAALVGYQSLVKNIDAKMAEIRQELDGAAERPAKRAGRRMSVAGRRNIARAQRQRWAERRMRMGLTKMSATKWLARRKAAA